MYAEKRRTACLQEVLREMQSLLHDNPERRIVVIIRLLKQEGILCTNSYKDIVLGYIKCTHSDGSSPVTTLVHHVFSCNFSPFGMGTLVRENRCTILMIINQTNIYYE